MRKLLRRLLWAIFAALVILSIYVQIPADPRLETLSSSGPQKALILYHPSRDTHFSDDVSLALAEGLKSAGLSVDRATINASTPQSPTGYALIAVVSNTYYWSPDLPTLWYLNRANLKDQPTLAIIGGGGSTDRAQSILNDALRATGSNLLDSRAYWLLRPNDETRLSEPNRAIALERAKSFATDIATKLSKGD